MACAALGKSASRTQSSTVHSAQQTHKRMDRYRLRIGFQSPKEWAALESCDVCMIFIIWLYRQWACVVFSKSVRNLHLIVATTPKSTKKKVYFLSLGSTFLFFCVSGSWGQFVISCRMMGRWWLRVWDHSRRWPSCLSQDFFPQNGLMKLRLFSQVSYPKI